MTITVELVGIAVIIAAQWADSIRRSSRVEAKVDRMEKSSVDAHERLVEHGERLSRIEGRLNGRPT